jgi:putative ABC transport system substrate-binding protein
MQRRYFITLLGGAATWPLASYALQKAMPVVGWLSVWSPPPNLVDWVRGPYHQGLSETGFVEGQNMISEPRWADFHYDRLPALAADLVSRKVDLIVTIGGLPSARAAKNATSTIPIVFGSVGDPVGSGLVASLAHPGGNLTGFSNLSIELAPKLLELISELVPQAGVIALLAISDTVPFVRNAQEAARTKGLQLHVLKAGTEDEIETAFASLVQLQAGALLVSSDAFFLSRRDKLVALASRYAVPTMYWWSFFVKAGGLISYGTDVDALNRQAGIYAGRILKGEKPADLPVQEPTKFELVVNLKTAKELGLTVPPSILARADEVIE